MMELEKGLNKRAAKHSEKCNVDKTFVLRPLFFFFTGNKN